MEVKQTAELEGYRALEKERERWEGREDRMLRQLKEMQMQLALAEERDRRDLRTDLSQYSDCAEGICGTGDKPSEGREAASIGVASSPARAKNEKRLLYTVCACV